LHRLVTELRVALDLQSVAILSPDVHGWRVDASAGEPVPRSPEDAAYSAELVNGSMLVVSGVPSRRGGSPIAVGVRSPAPDRPGHAQAPGRLPRHGGTRRGEHRARGIARGGVPRSSRSVGEHQGCRHQHPQRRRRLACGRCAVVLHDDRRGGRPAQLARQQSPGHGPAAGRHGRVAARGGPAGRGHLRLVGQPVGGRILRRRRRSRRPAPRFGRRRAPGASDRQRRAERPQLGPPGDEGARRSRRLPAVVCT